MRFRTGLFLHLVLLLAMVLLSAAYSVRLPATVPIHWNAAGQVDGYGPKWIVLIMMPVIGLFLTVMFPMLPSGSGRGLRESIPAYTAIMTIIMAMMTVMHGLILRASSAPASALTQPLIVTLLVGFALMGGPMQRVARNPFVGVRNKWTLSSDAVWQETHRYGGRLMMWGGWIGAAIALVGGGFWVPMAILMICSFLPLFYARRVANRIGVRL